MQAPSLRSAALNLALLALACVLTLGAAEVGLRLFYPKDTRYYVIRPLTRAVMHPDAHLLPGVQGPSRYLVNSEGIRGRDFSPPHTPEYRILAVGGSTTELIYIDGPRTWPALLESSLPRTATGEAVWVGNVGRSGLNARDHAVEVKYLLDEYPELDAVLVLAGVNDLTVALGQGSHYRLPPAITDPAAERRQIARTFQVAPGSLVDPGTEYDLDPSAPFYKRTALYQLLKRTRFLLTSLASRRGLIQDEKGETLAQWRENRRHASAILDDLPDLGPPLREYRRNLEAIVAQARARSLRLVFMTQPSIWRADQTPAEQNRLWLGGVGDFQTRSGAAYYSPGALAIAMDRFNQTMLDVCRTRGVECIDLAARVPKDTSVFYDDVHFTDCGSRLVASLVAEQLAQEPPFAARSAPRTAPESCGSTLPRTAQPPFVLSGPPK